MGFRFYMRCLRQVLGDWHVVFRLSWFWLLVLFGLLAAIALEIDPSVFSEGTLSVTDVPLPLLALGLGTLVVLLVALAAIAIGWHRWILRGDSPGWLYLLPAGAPVLRYILRSIWIILITTIVMALPVFLVLRVAADHAAGFPASPAEPPVELLALAAGTGLVIWSMATWVVLRIGLGLPALAIGKRLSIVLSFRLTREISGALIATALFMVLFSSAAVALPVVLAGGTHDAAILYPMAAASALFAWIILFSGFGVLTVLYAHVIEDLPV